MLLPAIFLKRLPAPQSTFNFDVLTLTIEMLDQVFITESRLLITTETPCEYYFIKDLNEKLVRIAKFHFLITF